MLSIFPPVFQVSSSCSSVYVDGSEARGALSAEISVRYGSLEGVATMTVWMPRTPLTVRLEDRRLSQVKGWRTAAATRASTAPPMEEGGGYKVKREVEDDKEGMQEDDNQQCR